MDVQIQACTNSLLHLPKPQSTQTLKTIYFLDVLLSYLKNGCGQSNFWALVQASVASVWASNCHALDVFPEFQGVWHAVLWHCWLASLEQRAQNMWHAVLWHCGSLALSQRVLYALYCVVSLKVFFGVQIFYAAVGAKRPSSFKLK
jgi:hypothetical protein